MTKPTKAKTPQIESTFLMLDVKGGREALRAMLKGGASLPIVIEGVIDDEHSSDDGVSQEFSVRVTSLKPKGRMQPFATVDNTDVGDYLIADGGFKVGHRKHHLTEGKRYLVYSSGGALYVHCDRWRGKRARHYLDGQVDVRRKWYVGLYKA